MSVINSKESQDLKLKKNFLIRAEKGEKGNEGDNQVKEKAVINIALDIKDTYILAVGPLGCLRILYLRAKEHGQLHKFKTLPVERKDFITAVHLYKIEKALREILDSKDINYRSIILYLTCSDIMAGNSFTQIIHNLEKNYGASIKLFKRGPLVKRRCTPKETLKILSMEIDEYFNENNLIRKDLKKDVKYLNVSGDLNDLNYKVPPFICDYSAACSVLYSFNSLNILYSPSGCLGGAIEFDESRDLKNTKLYSTVLNDLNITIGSEAQLIAETVELVKLNPEIDFISIIGTPFTDISNVNLKNVGEKIEKLVNLPVIVVPTNGFSIYSYGISKTLLSLGEKFITQDGINKNQVNIIGDSILGGITKEDLKEFTTLLNDNGVEVVLSSDEVNSLDSIKQLASGCVNLVVAPEGLELAKYLEDKYSVPYIVGLPVGIWGTKDLLKKLDDYVEVNLYERSKEIYDKALSKSLSDKLSNINVIIIGEPMFSSHIEAFLKNDFNIQRVTIVSHENFKDERRLYRDFKLQSEILFISEDELKENIASAEVIIADEVYKNFITNPKTVFINVPMRSLSNRDFNKDSHQLMGIKGFSYLSRFFESALF